MAPAIMTILLGGFLASSAVVLWSLLAPLGAIAFGSPAEARRWFVVYLVVLIAATVLAGPFRPIPAMLPNELRLGFLSMNIGAVSVIAFAWMVSGGYVSQPTVQARARL